MTKQAWRDVPAGRGLDRIVAERLGWTVKKRVVAPENRVYELYTPGGRYVWTVPQFRGEEFVWRRVPHYSTSVDVALTLIPEGVSFELNNDANGMYDYDEWEGIVDGYYGDADEPALAIVRAWLIYMDEQGDDDD